MNVMRVITGVSVVILFWGTQALSQVRERTVSPQRPSFSNNATTTYPRSIELEAGFSIDDHLVDTPALLKYGFNGTLEGFFGVSPILRRDFGPVEDTEAFEGATIGAKLRVQEASEDAPAIAFQVSTTEFDNFSFVAIYSQDLPEFTLDANAAITFNGGTTLTGIGTFSAEVNPQIGVFAEALLENNLDEGDPVLIIGGGGSLTRGPLQVWDAALHIGLIHADFDIRLQIGLTANLGILQP